MLKKLLANLFEIPLLFPSQLILSRGRGAEKLRSKKISLLNGISNTCS